MKKSIITMIILISTGIVNAQTLVKDISPGASSSTPYAFYPFNGKLLFCAYNSFNKNQVYISDGTAAGTTMLTTLPYTQYPFEIELENPAITYTSGGGFFYFNNKYYFLALRDSVYFGAIAGKYSIYQTDGTVLGTSQLDTLPIIARCSDFFIAKNSIGQDNLCAFIRTIPDTGGVPYHLFKYNFTTGISSVLYISKGFDYLRHLYSYTSTGRNINYPSIIGRRPYSFNNKIFVIKQDPAALHDSLFTMDIDGNTISNFEFPFHLSSYSSFGTGWGTYAFVNNKMVIYPYSTSESFGSEPHVYDFSTNTCMVLKDVNPYFNYSSNCKFFFPPYPNNYSKIYFNATDSVRGTELWVTDGSTTGTKVILGHDPYYPFSFLADVYEYVDNSYYFTGWYGHTYHTTGDSIGTAAVQCLKCPNMIDSYLLYICSGAWHDTLSNQDFFISTPAQFSTYSNAIYNVNSNLSKELQTMLPYSCSWSNSQMKHAIKIGKELYFSYTDCTTGYELYKMTVPNDHSEVSSLNNRRVIVYPNPTTGEISITEKVSNLVVYNIYGQKLKEANCIDKLNISEFPNGIYFLIMSDVDGMVKMRQTILKQ